MVRHLIGPVALIAGVCAIPAVAQTIASNVNVVREQIPAQKQTILANSAEDIALQEEIAKIKAYNDYINGQIGISGTYSEPGAVVAPAATQAESVYQGKKVQLYAPQTATTGLTAGTKVTYHTENSQTQQVAPVRVILRSKQASIAPVTYRVSQGDTLYSLARNHCVSVSDIQKLNALSGSAIKIGQRITLPASQCGATAQTGLAQATGSEARTETNVVRRVLPVQAGIKVRHNNKYAVLPKDSLYSIGRRYCVSAEELARLNGIDISTPIQPGQVLHLPENSCR